MILGQKLLKKAKKIIPGGNQLLSKRSEIFLPNQWPTYYIKAVGCEIWDLNHRHYYDFAGMGVTACTLGYADKNITNAITKVFKTGQMATLNAPEEVYLAQELIKMHPWSDMAKFCKSGGEACMIAIRIARLFSKKEKIAFCGYHGWHDWYLSANLGNAKNLKRQLLPGLNAAGVSKSFKNSIFPFFYNNIVSLEKVLQNNQIGIIIMEPMRGTEPKNNFLKKVRKLANKHKCILIFDEITSGFHDILGGHHLKLGVNPDMAIFGKSIGNGYPISAILGKKKIMNAAQDTFISSTMWTERAGFVAALETIKKMKKKGVQKKLVYYGKLIKKNWAYLAKKNSIKISISGLDSIPTFSFEYPNKLELATFFTQEMLKKCFLANTTLATTYAYNRKIINKYFLAVDHVFKKISFLIKNKKKIPLLGPIKHDTFKRLTG